MFASASVNRVAVFAACAFTCTTELDKSSVPALALALVPLLRVFSSSGLCMFLVLSYQNIIHLALHKQQVANMMPFVCLFYIILEVSIKRR